MNRAIIVFMLIGLVPVVFLVFSSCSAIPRGIVAVHSFEKEKYLGRWYEIARFDFRFEKDMDNTTATYSINEDGSIRVLNRGYNYKTKKWGQAIGNAKFRGRDDVGMLKVSFFGPFYAGYNVIAIDPEYKYALVCGKDLRYLWILSREKSIPAEVRENYLSLASRLGFDVSKLVWPIHDKD